MENKKNSDMSQENNEEMTEEVLTDAESSMNEAENKAGNETEKEDSSCKANRKDCKKDKKDKIAALEKQLKELTDKLDREKDGYLRLMAEFDNFRRRTSQERLDLISSASSDTIKGLLPILDDFERALKSIGDTDNEIALQAKTGTELIFNKMMSYLKGKGLSVIEAMGATFDTDLHEAVAQFPVAEEDKKGKVFDIVQTGYMLNGKVLRFAKVVVGI